MSESRPVELIPGTTLPVMAPADAGQTEGRGAIAFNPERLPVSLLEGIDDPAGLDSAERLIAAAALRAFDQRHYRQEPLYQTAAGTTDGTTGNLYLELWEAPQGMWGEVGNVTVDIPSGGAAGTITGSAPFANAASWAFLAVGSPTSGIGNTISAADLQTYRRGLVASSPASAGGPILPGQWTFSDKDAPVIWGGQQLFYVLLGGSQAGLLAQDIVCRYKIERYSRR
jgi:hypothetical protein